MEISVYTSSFSIDEKETKNLGWKFWLKFAQNWHPYPNSLCSNMGTPVPILTKFLNAKKSYAILNNTTEL